LRNHIAQFKANSPTINLSFRKPLKRAFSCGRAVARLASVDQSLLLVWYLRSVDETLGYPRTVEMVGVEPTYRYLTWSQIERSSLSSP